MKQDIADALQEATDLLTEALDLLSNAGPNPLCISETEYYDRLDKLRENCGTDIDEEE